MVSLPNNANDEEPPKDAQQLPPWLLGANPAQADAIEHGDGPLLIVAGAGTGKTRTLASRVAALIHKGVQPRRILLLTFTRRASSEMISRATSMVEAATGGPAAGVGRVWGGTFHAVANRLLRIYAPAVGLAQDFTVMDQGDAADMMNLIRNDLGVAKGDRRFPRKQTLVGIYSRAVNAQEKLDAVLKRHFPWCRDDKDAIKQIFAEYAARKKRFNVLDYDDLLLYWAALAASSAGKEMSARFDHILVDEYQDTNPIQAEILRHMRKDCPNITVVGDDAQSIYSFRAATVHNILDFPDQFSNTTQVTLDQNYRSTQPILEASNAVMSFARKRFTKNLWSQRESQQKPVLVTSLDEAEQCEAVCTRVIEHLEEGIPLIRQAVLFRTGHHSDQLEIELARRNIPFRKFGGLKFLEAAHIKDLVAFLRVVDNPVDEMSWFRVLQLIDGIGPKTARRLIDSLMGKKAGSTESGEETDGRPPSPFVRLAESPPQVPPAAHQMFAELRETLLWCRGISTDQSTERNGETGGPRRSPPLPEQLERLRDFYTPIFQANYDNAAVRVRDIEQLEQIATRYKSRSQFVTDLTLDPPESTSDLAQPPHLDDDYLILSTIHSAKGCEWDSVHVIHAADGMIPSDMAVGDEDGVEEERRLFYVALTRAKNHLYVHFPLRYYHRQWSMGDRHGFAQLTRYINSKTRKLFEEQAPLPGKTDSEPPTSVEDRLSGLWED